MHLIEDDYVLNTHNIIYIKCVFLFIESHLDFVNEIHLHFHVDFYENLELL